MSDTTPANLTLSPPSVGALADVWWLQYHLAVGDP